MDEEPEYEFDIAVSFAGEDREYVKDVVEQVKRAGHTVFYDDDHVAEMWGTDGVEFLTNVYLNRARYVVIFSSRQYAEKMWTRHERRAAMAKAISLKREYVLPVRLDDTLLEGTLPTTIYLDANRYGIDGLVRVIIQKLSGNPPAQPSSVLVEGKVPRTQEQVDAMIAERPPYWEYLLFAGVLRLSIDALAAKRRDFDMGYAASTGERVDASTILSFSQAALAEALQISTNFGLVLDPAVQEAAFGPQGEPGDPDRVLHLAQRYVSLYEDFMDWAARLRGASVFGEHGRAALTALAESGAVPNVRSMSDFVDNFVTEADTMVERTEAGEDIRIELTVTLITDEDEMTKFKTESELAARFE